MRRIATTLVVTLALALGLAACGPSAPPALEQLLNKQVPSYASATIADTAAAFTGATGLTHHQVTWVLDTRDAPEKVIAFYEKSLPAGRERDAEREKAHAEADDGERTIVWKPPQAAVCECVPRGKRGD